MNLRSCELETGQNNHHLLWHSLSYDQVGVGVLLMDE